MLRDQSTGNALYKGLTRFAGEGRIASVLRLKCGYSKELGEGQA